MLLILAVILSVIVSLWLLTTSHKPRGSLPPGPPRLPILGNIDAFPPRDGPEWRFWQKHLAEYGPVSSIELFGQVMIIINTPDAANEILERTASTTRSIPNSTMAKMSGWGNSLSTDQNLLLWREIRMRMKQEIGSKQLVSRHHPQMGVTVRRLMLNILRSPEHVREHFARDVAGFMLSMCYGYTIAPHGDDRMYHIAERGVAHFQEIFTPLNWMVNQFPIMRFIPSWFPGAVFVRKAAEFKACSLEFESLPRQFVEAKMTQGSELESESGSKSETFRPSMLSKMLEQGPYEAGSQQETAVLWSAIEVFLGGSETLPSMMTSSIVALSMNPDVQRKAQEELDGVVGYTKLPESQHRPSLPYVNAIVKEVFRWRPPAPVAAPHVAGTDIIWNGYFIPRGAYLIANIGALTHDPSIYANPNKFNPERFLATETNSPEPDPARYVFGFGRRKCPGRFVADDRLFLFIAHFLSCFEIKPKIDGAKEPKWLPGIITHPEPFEMRITPRSQEHQALIRSVEEEYPWDGSDAEVVKGFSV
ncbi:O-methylsterigmatocystin oxidoreductase [Aspergillus oleicola]